MKLAIPVRLAQLADSGVLAGWRGLGAFWALIAMLAVLGAGILQVLGPPEPEVVAEAPPMPGGPGGAPGFGNTPRPDGTPNGQVNPDVQRPADPAPASAAATPDPAPAAAPPSTPPPATTASAPPPAAAAPPTPPLAAVTPAAASPAAASPASGAAPAPAGVQTAALPVPADRPAGQPPPAVEPALLEPGPYGMLPRLGPDARSSIRAYGRSFDRQDARPRVGLILGGLGMNAAVTGDAIQRLPGAITLAFSPYAPRLPLVLDQARARGMELLLSLPLEPTGFPLNNPGDRALLTGLPASENDDRLAWAMARFTGYVGVIGAIGPMRGERFAALPDLLGNLQNAVHGRGLAYIDPRPGAPQPNRAWGRSVDIVVDEPATRGEIDRKLALLEEMARERGSALGYAGEASPVLVDRLAAWSGAIEQRGLVLAPVTALIRRPADAMR